MKTLDAWILALCTKFAHAFQRLTGESNYFLAKIGLMISSLHMVIEIINFFYPVLLAEKTSLSGFLFELVLLVSVFSVAYDLDNTDESQQLSSERVIDPSLPSIFDKYGWAVRLFFAFFFVFDVVNVFFQVKHSHWGILEIVHFVAFSFGITAFQYFVVVEPLRPGKSKIKQWIEKLSFSSREMASVGTKG